MNWRNEYFRNIWFLPDRLVRKYLDLIYTVSIKSFLWESQVSISSEFKLVQIQLVVNHKIPQGIFNQKLCAGQIVLLLPMIWHFLFKIPKKNIFSLVHMIYPPISNLVILNIALELLSCFLSLLAIKWYAFSKRCLFPLYPTLDPSSLKTFLKLET